VAETEDSLQVLAHQRDLDADPTPQSLAHKLLIAGRVEEAEAEARQAISDLEKESAALEIGTSDLQSQKVTPPKERAAFEEQNSPAENDSQLGLLAEALIAQGIALARLKKLEAAQANLERAIAVAEEAGAPDKASLVPLIMIEELEHLPRETLLSLYQQASDRMAKTRDWKLQRRVIDAAKKIMTRFWGEMDPDRELDILLAPPSLQEELIRFEERLIQHVLAQRNGSLSESASPFPLVEEPLTCTIELRPSLKKRTTGRHRSRNDRR